MTQKWYCCRIFSMAHCVVVMAVVGMSAFALSSCPASATDRKPNIVFLVADDLGYGDLSSYGGPVRTPNIDALAAAGLRFTDFHTNGPVCTPTRAALMTGRYQQRAQLENALAASPAVGLDPNQMTLSDLLRPAGYKTAIVGKWHLGTQAKFQPGRQSFDFFYGFLNGEIDYVNHLDSLGNLDWWRNTTSVTTKIYSTTAIAREAVGFMQRQQANPFFLFVSFQAPHVPYQAPGDAPVRIPGQPKAPNEGNRANYPLMVQAMDAGIGTIMSALRSLNLEGDTFVFFFSDNGAFAPGTNAPLRGIKGQLYEGGHRVPAIAYWPGHIVPGVSDETLTTMDVFPTMLELASASVPAAQRIDGSSFLQLLFDAGVHMPARRLFWMYQGSTAARDGNWKLVNTGSQTALYDLNTDLGETTDVAASNPGIVADLTNAVARWKVDVNAKPPVTVSVQDAGDTADPAHIVVTAEPASLEAIVHVEFWVNGALKVDDKAEPYVFDWLGAPPGTYAIKAKAFNVQGTSKMSAPVTVVVPPPASSQTVAMHRG